MEKKAFDYLEYYCKECKFYGYNIFGRGECRHPEAFGERNPYCKCCFRVKLKKGEM